MYPRSSYAGNTAREYRRASREPPTKPSVAVPHTTTSPPSGTPHPLSPPWAPTARPRSRLMCIGALACGGRPSTPSRPSPRLPRLCCHPSLYRPPTSAAIRPTPPLLLPLLLPLRQPPWWSPQLRRAATSAPVAGPVAAHAAAGAKSGTRFLFSPVQKCINVPPIAIANKDKVTKPVSCDLRTSRPSVSSGTPSCMWSVSRLSNS